MNYDLSQKILDEIKAADKILINCHRNPDPDSLGSALAMKSVLEKMGKETLVVSPTKLDKGVDFLKGFDEIEIVDFSKFDFDDFDLFVTLDSSSWGMITADENMPIPQIPIVVIDHHHTNKMFGKINLVDSGSTSACELLYKIVLDWGVSIDKEEATCLLTGIISDTGNFRYSGVGVTTLRSASELMEKGADKEKIIRHIFNNLETSQVKLIGVFLSNLKIEEEKFAWTAVDNTTYKEYGEPDNAKEYTANTFMDSIKGTEFGIIMVESEVNRLSVSFRARGAFDVSKIAISLGGGGHKAAAGATISGLAFNESVKKVLETAREVVRETQNG